MTSQITGIIGNSMFDIVSGSGWDSLIVLATLAAGSTLTGGFPLMATKRFEFSLNRVFILSLFLLRPSDIAVWLALASVIAGAVLRNAYSSRELWRYFTSGVIMVAALKYGPILLMGFLQDMPERILIVSVLPFFILSDIIINLVFTETGSNYKQLVGWLLISYLAVLPLAVMTVIMVLNTGIPGAILAVAGLTGFSFIGRSINRKHQWNTIRIKEISRQDRLATRLMESSSYGEFLDTLQNNLFEGTGSNIRTLTRSSGAFDWLLWSTDGQAGLMDSGISGTLPDKGKFSHNLSVNGISGTALGLSGKKDLIILLSGPEQGILQTLPSSLLDNFVLLLAHTWEAVGHSLRSERSFLAAAVTLARLADSKDDYTHGHSIRVASLSCSIGKYLKLSPDNIQTLRVAAILHDIGKLAIPVSILTKRGLLTKKEREIVEAHPVEGARIVSGLSGYDTVAKIIRSHHERLDGNGYPDGLKDGDIPFMARIVAIADTFDAITSHRSYHSISGWDNALETIRKETGSKFDSRIVSALEEILSDESMSMA